MTTSSWAVIVASGKDEMLNPETCTAFLNLQNKPILSYSLTAFEHCPEIEGVIVVAPRERLEQVVSVIQLFGCHKVRKVVPGGSTQYASFVNGMKYVDDTAKFILIHEASRPGIQAADVSELIKHAKKQGFVMAGHEVMEGVAKTSKTFVVEEFLEAGSIWTYGTPIVASADIVDKAIKNVTKKKKTVKSVLEAILLLALQPRLVKSTVFPSRINTIEQLRAMENVGLPG